MGLSSYFIGAALLAASVNAQVATFTSDNHGISVNIPSDTASSGSGPIYFQISAPSGTSWVGFGQGSGMSGSNMFIVYSKDSTNVTISPRLGTGHSMPQHDGSAQVTLLEGSGIASDGSMVANVRCDNCDSWSGGSMSFTDSSSSWIYASRSGDALDTDDVSASISQHDSDKTFSLDLSSGTGGSSSNPFVTQSEQPSESAAVSGSGTSQTATASQTGDSSSTSTVSTPTNGVSNPLASSGAGTTSGSDSGTNASQMTESDNTSTLLNSHGIIMSVLFLALFPFFSLTLYLPTTKKVRFIHAPLQVLATILLIIGMALGIVLGNRIDEIDGYHQIIGFIVVAMLVLFQPAMGLYQHLYYHKTGGRTIFGVMHRWLGRSMILLGIINGGLGWQLTNSTRAYVPYGVVAGIVFLIYLAVVLFAWYRSGQPKDIESEKMQGQRRGYEMQQPREPKHRRLSSDETPAYQQQQRRNSGRKQYTISSRN